MNKLLQDKVALVTGGGQGLGQAISMRLANEGAHVVVADLNEEGAKATAAQISANTDRQALAIKVDVTDEVQVETLVKRLIIPEDIFGYVESSIDAALWQVFSRIGGALPQAERKILAGEDIDSWRDAFRVIQGFEIQSTLLPFIQSHNAHLGPGVKERFEAAAGITYREAEEARHLRARIKAKLEALAGCARTARQSKSLDRARVTARAKALYDWVRRTNATSFGWIATFPTHGSSETCAISSAIRLAIELAATGETEYFDDVEVNFGIIKGWVKLVDYETVN